LASESQNRFNTAHFRHRIVAVETSIVHFFTNTFHHLIKEAKNGLGNPQRHGEHRKLLKQKIGENDSEPFSDPLISGENADDFELILLPDRCAPVAYEDLDIPDDLPPPEIW
jgi:hypothetical protein